MSNVAKTALEQTLDAMAISHVFGEPIDREGMTFLPAAKVRGGGGGGGDTEGNGGAGFGVAVEAGRHVRHPRRRRRVAAGHRRQSHRDLGGQLVAIVALLVAPFDAAPA